jgi:hypothetical protein
MKGRLMFVSCAAMILMGTTSALARGIYLSEVGSPNSLGTASSGNVINSTAFDAASTSGVSGAKPITSWRPDKHR